MTETAIPLLFDRDEITRLHSIAYAAAIQTGAKGYALDVATASIFESLADQANCLALMDMAEPPVSLAAVDGVAVDREGSTSGVTVTVTRRRRDHKPAAAEIMPISPRILTGE